MSTAYEREVNKYVRNHIKKLLSDNIDLVNLCLNDRVKRAEVTSFTTDKEPVVVVDFFFDSYGDSEFDRQSIRYEVIKASKTTKTMQSIVLTQAIQAFFNLLIINNKLTYVREVNVFASGSKDLRPELYVELAGVNKRAIKTTTMISVPLYQKEVTKKGDGKVVIH